MVELRYFRRRGHAQHDPQEYVDPAVLAEWESRDPIDLYRARLLFAGWASDEELSDLANEAAERCRVAAEQAIGEALPPGPEAVEDVYANLTLPHPWTRAPEPDPRRDHRPEGVATLRVDGPSDTGS
jgi:TPP-dependent pyruvate/acetoin dehydrogenase alpha subunit